jgi:predicted ArsR family transcriptional regulator
MSLVSATELAKALGVTTVAIRKRIWAYHADGLLG